MERVGVFGGTFDPVHVAHLVVAANARHALRLDRVLLVVANQPWQKAARPVTPAEDRFAMVAAAVEGRDGLEASRLEIDRGGVSFTADTLEELATASGVAGGGGADRELFLVLGADVAAQLSTWERLDTVRRLATVAVVDRPGARDPQLGPEWRVERVEIPRLEISASDLRRRAADGRPLDWLVPDPVIAYIRRRGLYTGGR
ncbi:MAG: nicotinate-nucleotide adenylyltransferase [Acidimicrobiales bacterium]